MPDTGYPRSPDPGVPLSARLTPDPATTRTCVRSRRIMSGSPWTSRHPLRGAAAGRTRRCGPLDGASSRTGTSSPAAPGSTCARAGCRAPTTSSPRWSPTCRGGPSAGRCTTASSTCRGCVHTYGVGEALPAPAAGRRPRRPHRALPARARRAVRDRRAAATTATAATASPGTATRSAAAAPTTPWSRSSRSATRAGWPCAPAAAATRSSFEMGHGDLVVMGGSCQRTWEHAVPKVARPAGPRISVQFRPLNVR